MNINEVLDSLRQSFQDKKWYYDVGLDDFNRPTVYVHFMNHEVLSAVPNRVGDYDVNVHYAAYKLVGRESYVQDLSAHNIKHMPDDTEPEIEEVDMAALVKELDRLERLCGSNILQDIFYETHDGPNAVTNLSMRFPDVREAVQKLYKVYGFDVIYDELDG